MPFITLDQCPLIPWKNGKGFTRELLKIGSEPFDFRISIATVNSDGPFSVYPEHDRILILLNKSLQLSSPSQTVILQALTPYYFSGENSIESKLLEGELTDFNIFYRKGFTASAEVIKVTNQCVEMDESTLIFDLKTKILYYQERSITVSDNSEVIIIKYQQK